MMPPATAAPAPEDQAKPETESHPGISLEPMYAEAVIAYNAKAPSEALVLLDRVLKAKPDYIQALELRALVLKELKRPIDSKRNYEQLLKASPPEKRAPYHFELGVLAFNAKRLKEAATHFGKALEGKFNVSASHFFLGMVYVGLSDKEPTLDEAESHFVAASTGDVDELKPPSHYYLGVIHYKNGRGSEGTYELIEARALAREMPGSAIANDIAKAVDAALVSYAKAQWYGNLTLMGGYNGNVSSLPSSATLPEIIAQQRTMQGILVASVGRMSSPLSFLQWIAAYRGNLNINTNKSAAAYQFLTHTATLYLTAQPLARTSYGLKAEGNLSFSDQGTDDPAVGSTRFKSYSLTGDIGPYLRTQLKRGMQLSLEAGYRPQVFYTQTEVTGTGFGGRATISYDRSSRYWNPGGFVAVDRNNAEGVNFRYWGFTAGASDLMRLSDRHSLTGTASIAFNLYGDSVPSRSDQMINLRLSWLSQLSAKWSLLADAGYLINVSSQPEVYQFTQPTITAGVSYNF